jgi:hypothetical protein
LGCWILTIVSKIFLEILECKKEKNVEFTADYKSSVIFGESKRVFAGADIVDSQISETLPWIGNPSPERIE